MPFSEVYKVRFEAVIKPAVEASGLAAYRVDNSRTGDSILTEIIDHIAHCELVIADVSVIGRDSRSGHPYRNGNVMYEVGIALACRQPAEVLLVRDDDERFLFDVSTIPHLTLDFRHEAAARARLIEAIGERQVERTQTDDARARMAARSLSTKESEWLRGMAAMPAGHAWSNPPNTVDPFGTIERLLGKQLAEVVGKFADGRLAYRLTRIGVATADLIDTLPTGVILESPSKTVS